MNTRFFKLTVLTSLCFAMSTAQATEVTKDAEKADEAVTTEAPAVPAPDAMRKKFEQDRQRAMEMRGPRDAYMAEVNQIKAQVEVRKEAILAENEAAAELKAKIAELDRELVEKSEALAAVFNDDAELQALLIQEREKKAAFRKSQMELRDQIRQQRLERRQLLERTRQAAAEKAEEAKEAVEAAEQE